MLRWIVLLVFAVSTFPATGYPAPFTVWLYGDGNSGRLFSELDDLVKGTGITVVPKLPMETTGTALPGGPFGVLNLKSRIFIDLANATTSAWPDLVFIGYSASAASYWTCATNTWTVDVAAQEATDIADAADFLRDTMQIRTLISIGPGVPSVGTPDVSCMQNAFNAVTYLLAYRAGSYPSVDWRLDTTVVKNWAKDRIHISCNPSKYKPMDPQTGLPYPNPCAGYNGTNGALTVARRVLQKLKTLQ